MSYSAKHILAVSVFMMLALVLAGCEQPKPQAVKTVPGDEPGEEELAQLITKMREQVS